MKLIKRVTTLSVLCIGAASCFSNVYATERTSSSHYDTIASYGFSSNKVYRTTVGDPDFRPGVSLSQETRNSKVYIVIKVNDMDLNVSVSGPSSSSTGSVVRDDQYSYRFLCEAKKDGWYDVTVSARNGQKSTESIHVKISDKATKLELSKKYKDNKCYLVIDADDDDGIKNVSVNNTSISFNSTGDKVEYRVYNSGTYKVTVTDKNDNRKTESLYIDVDGSEPTLKLSKEYKSGKWYLRVKADSDEKITKLTINNTNKSFPQNGGTEDYEITASGTYKVVMTDKSGVTKTESIYIDINEKNTTKPTVKVSQNYKTGSNAGWYLIIKATDNGSISSVKVNGTNVPFDSSKGEALYYVPTDGNYNIEVTDNDGNTTTTSTFAAGNTNGNTNTNSNTNISTNSTASNGNSTIVFKLNNKSWTMNGVVQETMTVAPKSVNSRVYLPIRYIAYALGIDSGNINWNPNTQTVTIYDGNNVVKVKVGSKTMYVNDRAVSMDSAPLSNGGRVMLPISQIRPAFAYKNIQLNWNNTTKQLTIKR